MPRILSHRLCPANSSLPSFTPTNCKSACKRKGYDRQRLTNTLLDSWTFLQGSPKKPLVHITIKLPIHKTTSTQCVNSHSVQVTLVNGLSMPQCSIYQPRAASQTAFLVVLTGWLIILSVAWVNRHKRGQITRRLNPYSRETYTLRAF